MQQRIMAVRFLFNRGAFFDAILPENEAIQIINDFASGNNKPFYKGGPYDYVEGGGRWSARTADLIAVFQATVNKPQAPVDGGIGLGAGRGLPAAFNNPGRS